MRHGCINFQQSTKTPQMPANALTKQDYLDLWKFFSEDTAKIKDKLWTIYALMSGLMAFMLEDKAEGFCPVMGVVRILKNNARLIKS
jgi:hypothetical protein